MPYLLSAMIGMAWCSVSVAAQKILLEPYCGDDHKVKVDDQDTETDSMEGRIIYLSKVKKGAQDRFLTRMVLNDFHVVATRRPVFDAIESTIIYERPGERVYLAEGINAANVKLEGEIGRAFGLVVVVRPEEGYVFLHPASHPEIFWLPVSRREVVAAPYNDQISPIKELLAERQVGEIEATSEVVQSLAIDPDFLKKNLRELSGDLPVMIGGKQETITERGSKGKKDLARSFLKQLYEGMGFKVSFQSYGNNSANFVAEKVGTDPTKIVIVSSHLDSVNNAGADDNGAGTITALAIAKALSDKELRYTLRIVAFDQEEVGLVGSEAYVKFLKQNGDLNKLVGVFNIEMTAYDANNDKKFHVIDCNENTSADLSKLLMDAIQRYNLPLVRSAACTDRSDHSSFWQESKPAVVISQDFFGGDSNPCYHRSCDKIDRLNFDYMASLTEAMAKAIGDLMVVAK